MKHEKKPSRLPESGPHAGLPLNNEESCLEWEAALADLFDDTLLPGEEAAFRQHAAGCAGCGAMLRESGHGREWVRLLHDAPPAVPENLLGKILARTANPDVAQGSGELPPGLLHAPLPAGNVMSPSAYAFRGQREARLLMTAAMAFFSIALTLSLTGIRLGDLHAAGHAPALFEMTASRQFFNTKKQVVSFCDNLRLVREVEVSMSDAMPRTTK